MSDSMNSFIDAQSFTHLHDGRIGIKDLDSTWKGKAMNNLPLDYYLASQEVVPKTNTNIYINYADRYARAYKRERKNWNTLTILTDEIDSEATWGWTRFGNFMEIDGNRSEWYDDADDEAMLNAYYSDEDSKMHRLEAEAERNFDSQYIWILSDCGEYYYMQTFDDRDE